MNKFEAIIFDWDGTLAKTLHLWLSGYRLGLENQNHTFLDSVIARDFFYEHDKAQEKYPAIDISNVASEAREYVKGHVNILELYEGVNETLKSLRDGGLKIALVSSSPRQLLEAGLKVHNLSDYFSSIIAGDDVTKHKPHPEAFLQTLKLISANPEQTLIIGDSATDIIAGKLAKTATCLFTPQENAIFYNFTDSRLLLPDYEISNIGDLLSI